MDVFCFLLSGELRVSGLQQSVVREERGRGNGEVEERKRVKNRASGLKALLWDVNMTRSYSGMHRCAQMVALLWGPWK